MADVTITATALTAGTETADLVGSGTSVTAAQTFAVAANLLTSFPPPKGGESRIILVVEEQGGGAATITVDAGDYPPAMLSSKGADTITLATSDLKIYMLEPGRHMQSDGTITGTVNTQTCKIRALFIPSGH